MKRTLLIALAALMAFAAPAAADPTSQATGAAKFTSAAGAAVKVTFNAKDPAAPKGRVTVEVESRGVDFTGAVTCLNIVGNVAVMTGLVDRGTTDSGPYFRLTVQDNGEGAGSPPDELTIQRNGPTLADCTTTPGATRPLEHGNVQVKP